MLVIKNFALAQHPAVRHIAPTARLILTFIDEERFALITFALLDPAQILRHQNLLDQESEFADSTRTS